MARASCAKDEALDSTGAPFRQSPTAGRGRFGGATEVKRLRRDSCELLFENDGVKFD